ncbi:MAG: hypothetical protein ACYDFS_06290 [Vulcanimicrobiaceae bacterium]
MKPLLRALLPLALLAALSACGSVTTALNFKAPSGWTSSLSIMGLMQVWTDPKNSHAVVMLLRSPVAITAKEALSHADLNHAKVLARKRVTICGNRPARWITLLGAGVVGTSGGNKGPERLDMLITKAAGATYVAMYARPAGAPADPQAEAAVRSVCPKA